MGCVIKYKGQSIPEEQFLQYLNKQIAINNLFNENENLANTVYKALGFEQDIPIPDYITTSRPYSDENIGSRGRTGNMVEFTSPEEDLYRQNMGGYLIQTNDEGRLYITDIAKFNENSTFKGLGTVAYVDFYENYKHKSQGLTTDKSLTSDGLRVLERLEKIGLVYKTDAVLVDDTQKHRLLGTTLYKYNKPLYEFNFNWSRNQITPQQKQQALQAYSQYLESLNKPNTNPILQGNQTNIEEIITQLEKEGLLEIDCKGKLKAEKGLATSFVKGGKWKVIKDLKGYPTHKEGGVDLTIGKGGVSIKNGNTQFTAKYGLVIPKN